MSTHYREFEAASVLRQFSGLILRTYNDEPMNFSSFNENEFHYNIENCISLECSITAQKFTISDPFVSISFVEFGCLRSLSAFFCILLATALFEVIICMPANSRPTPYNDKGIEFVKLWPCRGTSYLRFRISTTVMIYLSFVI